MPNCHVLFAADDGPTLGTFSPPTKFFDLDPGADTISPAASPISDPNSPSAYVTRMLILPTGQVLLSVGSHQLWVYTPHGAPPQRLKPSIESVKYNGGGLFTLTGQQLNGQDAGSGYGDDAESDENYPIVRLIDTAGHIFYARTTHWSTTGVATGCYTRRLTSPCTRQ